MSYFKVGVMLGSLQKPTFEESVSFAYEIGADGFQMGFTDEKPMDAERIAAGRAHIEKTGIEVSAVCGDIGSWTDAERNVKKLAVMENIMNFSRDIGTHVVTGHIGVIPGDKKDPVYAVMLRAMNAVGKLAKARGITYAIETGPENTEVLRMFLDDLDGGVGVNYDPANLVMGGHSANGADGVARVAPYIVHTHAKDGRPGGPEVPLGEGSVDFPAWLAELKKGGYRGFLTIERECGDDPAADCKNAMGFLRGVDAGLK